MLSSPAPQQPRRQRLPLLLLLICGAWQQAAAFVLPSPRPSSPSSSAAAPAPAPAARRCRALAAAPTDSAPSAPSGGGGSASEEGPSYWEWLGRQVELKLRPKPYGGLRLQPEKDLAVLLMRSSYAVADDLDFVAMDVFQRSQFLFRQAEWEDYLNAYPPLTVKQGFLTDPNYFDFINFVQYATINREMRQGKLVFVEQFNAEGDKQVVKRDPRLEDNRLLPAEHARRVGDRILEKFLEAPEIYRPVVVGPGQGFDALLDGVRRVEDLFVAQRFNSGGTVTPLSLGPGRQGFQVVSRAPANLWGLQNLMFRKDALLNDFEAKAILAYLRACGVDEGRVSYRVEPRPERAEVAYTFTLT